MPDKPLTIATYAAGASLAAITLVYVFGPTFFFDDEASSTRKKGVVGLNNAANDCFINSILQALAGLPDLRLYLIREIHRRKLDGPEIYEVDLEKESQKERPVDAWKLEGLQKGVVTHALKEILDNLNERPLYRKTISPQPFIRALERAFGARISRQQQDAQEFLQLVTERLCEEYHAGRKARKQSAKPEITISSNIPDLEKLDITEDHQEHPNLEREGPREIKDSDADEAETDIQENEEGFPFEGKIESQIECLTCGFKPRPAVSTFVTLTLNVPQQSSTSLNSCFDGMLKVEHIEDFKCDYCRLEHALRSKTHELTRTSAAQRKEQLESDISKIRAALEDDPEKPPTDVELPDSSLAPRRRIARHMYISSFPKVLAVHLSRSMFSAGSSSTKNMAKVAFPESLPLGGILNQKKYQLLGIITHKGSHSSGHYESFRRQVTPAPYSTPHSFGAEGIYSVQGTPNLSAVPSPRISTANLVTGNERPSRPSSATRSPAQSSVLSLATESISPQSLSSQSSLGSREHQPTSSPRDEKQPPSSSPTSSKPKSVRSVKSKAASLTDLGSLKRKQKRASQRWWRISDDKIKESKTSEVLSMQKEVYLLFYELDRRTDGEI
jgi:ubiquitin carboxyl-terminal hydrolase 16